MQIFISSIDIFIIPHSNLFGSPIVLFEFMAMSKPVVAPALPPIEDVIVDDINGLLLTPEDKSGLVNKMNLLIAEPKQRDRLGKEAYKMIHANHTWSICGKKILDLLTNLKAVDVK